MIDLTTRIKIRMLYKEIENLYSEARKRLTGDACDICGRGHTISRTGNVYKVRRDVQGYEHRLKESPQLCHRHACGWARSHSAYNWDNRRTDEEINLHFAAYLAKQLEKVARLNHTGETK